MKRNKRLIVASILFLFAGTMIIGSMTGFFSEHTTGAVNFTNPFPDKISTQNDGQITVLPSVSPSITTTSDQKSVELPVQNTLVADQNVESSGALQKGIDDPMMPDITRWGLVASERFSGGKYSLLKTGNELNSRVGVTESGSELFPLVSDNPSLAILNIMPTADAWLKVNLSSSKTMKKFGMVCQYSSAGSYAFVMFSKNDGLTGGYFSDKKMTITRPRHIVSGDIVSQLFSGNTNGLELFCLNKFVAVRLNDKLIASFLLLEAPTFTPGSVGLIFEGTDIAKASLKIENNIQVYSPVTPVSISD